MLQRLARAILRISGWTVVGEAPAHPKAVIIAAPHTSNWDGVWLLVCKVALDMKLHFFAKHTLFWWPLGPLLKSMGAIPVVRSTSGANVDRIVRLFERNETLHLALAPEGTRRWKPYWRTGFYRIARAARVPIVMAFIDYRHKRAGIGPVIVNHDDVQATLAAIRAFYATCAAAKPGNMGPIGFPPDTTIAPSP